MRETDTSLPALALLYANGELEGADSAAFEARLSTDQSAREALAEAVELSQTLTGSAHALNPCYRVRVQARLLPRGLWSRLGRRRPYRGHPIVWLVAGALVASLVLLAWPLTTATVARRECRQTAQETSVVPTSSSPAPTVSEASIWSDLSNADHLVHAVTELKSKRERSLTKKSTGLELRSLKGPKQG